MHKSIIIELKVVFITPNSVIRRYHNKHILAHDVILSAWDGKLTSTWFKHHAAKAWQPMGSMRMNSWSCRNFNDMYFMTMTFLQCHKKLNLTTIRIKT
jgi:hypothetical protein